MTGAVTGVQLPGGYGFRFTGLWVRQADGRRFEIEGIVPDVPVRAASDLAACRDPKLKRISMTLVGVTAGSRQQ